MRLTKEYLKPQLKIYSSHDNPPSVVPAHSDRPWMDLTHQRFAYRCTPMTVANASGWEILCPTGFTANWSGGDAIQDLAIIPDEEFKGRPFVNSHFGHGILTFHPGYLFRTSSGWAIWVRGCPNVNKYGLTPLEGLVETDWLPFEFTMNWRFTHEGTVRFERNEPFCFFALFPHAILDEVEPQSLKLSDEPELQAANKSWTESRLDFNRALAANDPAAVALGWQKGYVQGKSPDGRKPAFHISKRRLKSPRQP
jgi:hypothetical protein